jgi:hypothetical protein
LAPQTHRLRATVQRDIAQRSRPFNDGVRCTCRFCSIWTAQAFESFEIKGQGGEEVAQIMRLLGPTTMDRDGRLARKRG